MVLCKTDDVVLLKGFRVGIVRYRGNVSGHNEMFVGVEIFMTDSVAGNSDGTYNGKRYFKCDIKRGIFMKESEIQRVITGEVLLNKLVKVNEQKKKLEQENSNYEVMADLYLKKSSQWKEQLKNLEIAHDELESEIEFLKRQLMVKEKEKNWKMLNRIPNGKYNNNKNEKINQQNDPFKMISNNNTNALHIYLTSNKHIINAFNDPEKGNLPIWSVRNNNIEALKILHEFDADLDQCDDLGWTPLMYTVIYNNYEIAKLLIEYGCDIEAVDHGCWSSVIFCCILNNSKILKLLAKHDGNIDRFIYANKNPLILCAERGFFNCLKILRQYNVDIMDAVNIVQHSNHQLMTPINRKKSVQVLSQ
eukprot:380621_1